MATVTAKYLGDLRVECTHVASGTNCEVDLDEDEMARFLQDKFYNCPYYQLGDEYRIVRKQM